MAWGRDTRLGRARYWEIRGVIEESKKGKGKPGAIGRGICLRYISSVGPVDCK